MDAVSISTERHRRHAHRRLSEHTPPPHKVCDMATEALLYLTVVFGPWAFGTTQEWAKWTMNGVGYLLGALWLAKWIIRRATGFNPGRWGEETGEGQSTEDGKSATVSWPTAALAGLTILLVAYCFVSAWNAAATFDFSARDYQLRDHYFSWLPHSFDSNRTWRYAFQYLSVALLFWAARDWLLTKTRRERLSTMADGQAQPEHESRARNSGSGSSIPVRLQRLLWVICLNGAVLAIESLLQRMSGTNKLLWLVEPWFNNDATLQWGPYAYRGNGAQYLNLVWPICLGFWLFMHLRQLDWVAGRQAVTVTGPHTVLLPGIALMAACPFVTANRVGAILCGLGLLAVTVFLAVALPSKHWKTKIAIVTLVLATFLVAFLGDLTMLQTRLQWLFDPNMSGRKEIYEGAAKMASEYGFLGSGPGTFETLYPWYKPTPESAWESLAHDDWMETFITFGSLGLGMIVAVLMLVGSRLAQAFRDDQTRWLAAFIALSLSICLVHAKVDFPLQVDSILRLFVILSCVAWCLPSFRYRQKT
jgi:hypothetical protein